MNNNLANFRVQAHALTDKGRRPNNEDFVTFFEPTDPQERLNSGCIYIVADGVGGASVGERASQYAAEKVLYEYLERPDIEPGKRLKQVITRVNREIFDYAEERGTRMATTLAVAVVLSNSLVVANVGDSRVYLIRGTEVKQITRDHNIVGELMRDGVMTEAEALKSKAKNRLTRSIGGEDEAHVDVFGPIPIQPDDKIMLCSDGLTRYALKEDIANLTSSGSPEQITEGLLAFAKERGRGGADNISIITVAYEPSAELGVTIRRPRPHKPVQPWEIMDTLIEPIRKSPFSRSGRWIGIGLLVVIGLLAAFLLVWFKPAEITSPIPTATLMPSPSPVLSPTVAPVSPTVSSPSPSPTVVQPTNTLPATPTINCLPSEPLNVRRDPSTRSEDLGNLECGHHVTLTGRYFESGNREWFQIWYVDANDQTISAWVIASRVDVLPETRDNLPILDYNGMTITPFPSPIPESTFTPGPSPTATLKNCEYTIAKGNNLSLIAEKFGIGSNNFRSIVCAPDSPDCNLTDPAKIQPGWRVIVPGVLANVCVQEGGTPRE